MNERAAHYHADSGKIPELDELARRLQHKSLRLTAPRRAILELLRHESHPLTIKQIFRGLRAQECDLVTVYRSMRSLEMAGMVKRYQFGDRKDRFELVRGPSHGHHHHLVCTGCTRIVELEDCLLHEIENKLAERSGFKGITHKLEFFGVCDRCQEHGGPKLKGH